MQKIFKILAAAIIACASVTTFAQRAPTRIITDIVPKPNGFKVAPAIFNPNLNLPGTPGMSDWLIAQWNSPSPLSAFYNNSYMVQSNMSRFIYNKSAQQWEMALNGDKSACDQETHLFAEPVSAETYVTPDFANITKAPLVENGKKIIHTLNVMPKYYQQFPSSCLTQGSFITSMILKNLDDPYMTVFYQLNLHSVPVNPTRNPNKFWFYNGSSRTDGVYNKTWGYSDVAQSFGYAYPGKGQTIYFNKDIKAKLRAIILDPTNSIPSAYKNPDRWVLSNHYHGPHMWGGIRSTYIVNNFSLYEEQTICSYC